MMWKSVFYKEWLKIRWFWLGYTTMAIFVILYLFLTVKHSFAFTGGKNTWNNILFLGNQFFSPLKFVPLAGGLAVALAQYFPETVNKRIKLTLHLPIKDNKVLLLMHSFGGACLMISYILTCGLFAGFGLVYFPVQIVTSCMISIFPWFLAGLTGYFLIALIVLEPNWKFRIYYSLIGGFFLSIYLKSTVLAGYSHANSGLFILTALLSVVFLFSAYRFKKGEV